MVMVVVVVVGGYSGGRTGKLRSETGNIFSVTFWCIFLVLRFMQIMIQRVWRPAASCCRLLDACLLSASLLASFLVSSLSLPPVLGVSCVHPPLPPTTPAPSPFTLTSNSVTLNSVSWFVLTSCLNQVKDVRVCRISVYEASQCDLCGVLSSCVVSVTLNKIWSMLWHVLSNIPSPSSLNNLCHLIIFVSNAYRSYISRSLLLHLCCVTGRPSHPPTPRRRQYHHITRMYNLRNDIY